MLSLIKEDDRRVLALFERRLSAESWKDLCPPCEDNCRRGSVDECISIKWLKRFVADYELEKRGTSPQERGGSFRKSAIIGAGLLALLRLLSCLEAVIQ